MGKSTSAESTVEEILSKKNGEKNELDEEDKTEPDTEHKISHLDIINNKRFFNN